MPAKKFTATLPDGSIVKRSSATMDYKFVIVGRIDMVAAREACSAKVMLDNYRKNYRYYQREAAIEGGDGYQLQHTAHAKTLLLQFPTLESYVDDCVKRDLDRLAQRYGTGDLSDWIVCGWSQSVFNANKMHQANAKHYVHVRTIPVDQ